MGGTGEESSLVGGKDLFSLYLDTHEELYPEIVIEIAVIDSVSIILFQILNFMYYKSVILGFLRLFSFQGKKSE